MIDRVHDSRLKKLGWRNGLNDVELQNLSKAQKGELASLLAPRTAMYYGWFLAALVAGGVLSAILSPDWQWNAASGIVVAGIIAMLAGAWAAWIWTIRRVGGKPRNVGLALRSILQSFQFDDEKKNHHWRDSILKKAKRFESASVRANTSQAFRDRVCRDIYSWNKSKVSNKKYSAAAKRVREAAAEFSSGGYLDAEAYARPASIGEILKRLFIALAGLGSLGGAGALLGKLWGYFNKVN